MLLTFQRSTLEVQKELDARAQAQREKTEKVEREPALSSAGPEKALERQKWRRDASARTKGAKRQDKKACKAQGRSS